MLNIVHYLESYTIHVWYIISIYIYLLTFTITKQPNAGKYASPMDGMRMYLKPYITGTNIFQTSSSGIDSTVASHKLRHNCTKLSKESSGSGAACSQANTKTFSPAWNWNQWLNDHGTFFWWKILTGHLGVQFEGWKGFKTGNHTFLKSGNYQRLIMLEIIYISVPDRIWTYPQKNWRMIV